MDHAGRDLKGVLNDFGAAGAEAAMLVVTNPDAMLALAREVL